MYIVSDDTRAKLHRLADTLADVSEMVEVARGFLADMRSGCGEALEDASLKPSPQGEHDGPGSGSGAGPSGGILDPDAGEHHMDEKRPVQTRDRSVG